MLAVAVGANFPRLTKLRSRRIITNSGKRKSSRTEIHWPLHIRPEAFIRCYAIDSILFNPYALLRGDRPQFGNGTFQLPAKAKVQRPSGQCTTVTGSNQQPPASRRVRATIRLYAGFCHFFHRGLFFVFVNSGGRTSLG